MAKLINQQSEKMLESQRMMDLIKQQAIEESNALEREQYSLRRDTEQELRSISSMEGNSNQGQINNLKNILDELNAL